MKHIIAALIACGLLVGCSRPAERTSETSNSNFNVERLFTHEGCTAYRFWDAGIRRYYVACDGRSASTSWTERCGKNCSRPVEIATAIRFEGENQ